jgi:hypothetical protein
MLRIVCDNPRSQGIDSTTNFGVLRLIEAHSKKSREIFIGEGR